MKSKLITVTSFLMVLSLHAQEWTRFRGPNGTGISDTTTVPVKWTDDHIQWKTTLPGGGHSSPVLWGNRLFVTGSPDDASSHEIYCLDATTGDVLWTTPFPYHDFVIHQFNSHASPTVAVDGEYIFTSWSVPESLQLAALNHEGNVVWQKDLGPFVSQHGSGTSPMIYDDRVILTNDQQGESFMIAVDRETGETLWKVPRGSAFAGYGTPVVYETAYGKELLLINSQADGMSAIDPMTGATEWSYKSAFDKRSVSTAVFGNGLVFGTCGSGNGGDYLVALRIPTEPGQQPEEVYRIRRNAPYVPTSIVYNNRAYLWDDSSFLTCIDLNTGRIIWNERINGRFFSSPVLVNGNLYCVSDTGVVVVVEASDNFNVLAENPLGELSNATPAVADGSMFVRTFKHVIRIGTEQADSL